MDIFNIDFRFIESKYELTQVKQFVDIVENQISKKEQEYKQKYEKHLKPFMMKKGILNVKNIIILLMNFSRDFLEIQ